MRSTVIKGFNRKFSAVKMQEMDQKQNSRNCIITFSRNMEKRTNSNWEWMFFIQNSRFTLSRRIKWTRGITSRAPNQKHRTNCRLWPPVRLGTHDPDPSGLQGNSESQRWSHASSSPNFGQLVLGIWRNGWFYSAFACKGLKKSNINTAALCGFLTNHLFVRTYEWMGPKSNNLLTTLRTGHCLTIKGGEYYKMCTVIKRKWGWPISFQIKLHK